MENAVCYDPARDANYPAFEMVIAKTCVVSTNDRSPKSTLT